MDNPLSSILRPGPAAPANEQTPRETPVEGGDAAARRAIEQNSYPPARQADWVTRPVVAPVPQTIQPLQPAPQALQPVPQPVRPIPQAIQAIPQAMQPMPRANQPMPLHEAAAHVTRPVVSGPTQPVRPVAVAVPRDPRPLEDNRVASQPASAAAADDLLAGLERAALRDISNDPGQKPAQAQQDPADAEAEAEKARLKRERRLARLAAEESSAEPTDPADAEKAQRRREKRLAALAATQEATDPAKAERLKKQEAIQRRKERQAEKKGTALQPSVAVLAAAGATLPAKTDKAAEKAQRKRDKEARTSTAAPRERGIPWTALSFLVMVLIPAAFATFYYVFLASPQYQVETQFSVRGSGQSSMASLGLGSLLGSSTAQTGDSYIVTSYVESLQLIRDVQQELGIDLRQFFVRDEIDWLYRIDPDMPLEKFTSYWRDMTDVSFNSTTGNTTLYIYSFSAEDSKAIADAVLKVSEKLVNELSESNRRQVMQVASRQVDRAEERLRKVQGEIRKLRVEEKITDPATLIQLQNQVTSGLQNELASLKARMNALMKSVSADAPQAKVLQKQIEAREEQLKMHEAQLGAAIGKDPKSLSEEEKANLAGVLNKFEELTIEQGFATQAYTTALAAFETAIVEAQRQERYFATFVAPTRPEIALFPMRYLDSFIAFLVLLAAWMVTQFLYRSFRDHAI